MVVLTLAVMPHFVETPATETAVLPDGQEQPPVTRFTLTHRFGPQIPELGENYLNVSLENRLTSPHVGLNIYVNF